MAHPQRGPAPRKRFGQNFLQDDGVIQAIVRAIAPIADDHVVEIGPGQGALTGALVTSGCQLDAIELDRDLTTGLLAAFSSQRVASQLLAGVAARCSLRFRAAARLGLAWRPAAARCGAAPRGLASPNYYYYYYYYYCY